MNAGACGTCPWWDRDWVSTSESGIQCRVAGSKPEIRPRWCPLGTEAPPQPPAPAEGD